MQAFGADPPRGTNVTTRTCKNTNKLADHGPGEVQTPSKTQSASHTDENDANAFPRSPSAKRRKRDLSSERRDHTQFQPHLKMATASVSPGKRAYDFGQNSNRIFSNRVSGQGRGPRSGVGSNTTKGSSHDGVKRLTVRNLQTPKTNPQQYFTKIWTQLEASLSSIFRNEDPPYSLEELYKGVENLCRQGNAETLYNKLRQKCKENAIRTKEGLAARGQLGQDVSLVQAFVEAWTTWDRHMTVVRNIFFYMDQSYLLRSSDKRMVKEIGLDRFKAYVFNDDQIKPNILRGTLKLIKEDREKSQTLENSSIIRQIVTTLRELGLYKDAFEPAFLEAAKEYLTARASEELDNGNLAELLEQSTQLHDKEMHQSDAYDLNRSTKGDLSELFDKSVIQTQYSFLTQQDGLLDLFESNNSKALHQAYNFLDRIGKTSELGLSFDTFVNDEGSSIVFDETREAEMVPRLLEFKQHLDYILSYSFRGNENLANVLHKAFENFINKTKKTQSNWGTDNPKPGEMIAKYVDALLKGGIKAIPSIVSTKNHESGKGEEDDEDMADEELQINRQLDLVLDLFRFVHGKAVFEAFYKKDLARRLLMGRSASNDAEKSMLSRLKTECGSGFTHNLESMFKDMDLAREEMLSYNSVLAERDVKAPIDLSANVLSSAAWPTYPDVPVNIPISISKAMSKFEIHYKSKYQGRKLTWKHALSHCQLRARFPKGNKEVVVSGFQAIVLLLFNDVPDASSLSYEDIQASTGLSDAELTRTLQSLACAKYRVLTKTPKGRDVDPADQFSFNTSFQDKKLRIKINQVQLKETKEENKETHERVAADRHYETQAAIVRIMKSRKSIKHAELVAEVINATKSRGVLEPTDIKKNIEKLIEKDYMDREANNTYVYVA